jgi:hypothetical protein
VLSIAPCGACRHAAGRPIQSGRPFDRRRAPSGSPPTGVAQPTSLRMEPVWRVPVQTGEKARRCSDAKVGELTPAAAATIPATAGGDKVGCPIFCVRRCHVAASRAGAPRLGIRDMVVARCCQWSARRSPWRHQAGDCGWLAGRWRGTVWVWRLVRVVGLAIINAAGVFAQLVAAHVQRARIRPD